jgi:hypothetical protein
MWMPRRTSSRCPSFTLRRTESAGPAMGEDLAAAVESSRRLGASRQASRATALYKAFSASSVPLTGLLLNSPIRGFGLDASGEPRWPSGSQRMAGVRGSGGQLRNPATQSTRRSRRRGARI